MNLTLFILTFLLAFSAVVGLGVLYYKTRAKAAILFGLGYLWLAGVRLGIIFQIPWIVENSAKLTVVNTFLMAASIWWLVYVVSKMLNNRLR